MELRTNAVKRIYVFRVVYKDGRDESVAVEAESYAAAKLLLPTEGRQYYDLIFVRKKDG